MPVPEVEIVAIPPQQTQAVDIQQVLPAEPAQGAKSSPDARLFDQSQEQHRLGTIRVFVSLNTPIFD